MAISGVTDYTNTYAADRANGSSTLNGDSQAYLNSLKEKYPGCEHNGGGFQEWETGRCLYAWEQGL